MSNQVHRTQAQTQERDLATSLSSLLSHPAVGGIRTLRLMSDGIAPICHTESSVVLCKFAGSVVCTVPGMPTSPSPNSQGVSNCNDATKRSHRGLGTEAKELTQTAPRLRRAQPSMSSKVILRKPGWARLRRLPKAPHTHTQVAVRSQSRCAWARGPPSTRQECLGREHTPKPTTSTRTRILRVPMATACRIAPRASRRGRPPQFSRGAVLDDSRPQLAPRAYHRRANHNPPPRRRARHNSRPPSGPNANARQSPWI